MRSRAASRTAVLVCQGRAAADGRWAAARFHDPVARQLLRPGERALVDRARAGLDTSDWRARMAVESVTACAEVMVPRTVAIDDAIGQAGSGQVVILGTGLDSRPFRLSCLAGAVVYAVDHPASLSDARARAAGLALRARTLVRVPCDFKDGNLDAALSRSGHDASLPTTWVWEGVVPYLSRGEVGAAVLVLARRSCAGSHLILTYQARSPVTAVGRHASRLLTRLLRLDSPLATEPWRSLWTPGRIRRLLQWHGFTVHTDVDLLSVAGQLGSPTNHARSLRSGRLVLAGC